MTKLAIVESPAKAKTISSFLGNEWTVLASYGHVRDLPEKGLGVDVDNHFKPTYELRARKEALAEIKAAMKDAEELFLATDEDREGEAIAWHLHEVLKPRVPVRRMVFHEITRAAIDEAVNNARDINYALVDAQETRRIVDRLYGFEVSPVLWRKIGQSARSAGRVQSPAVRLVVERERERMAFVAAGYWDLSAAFPTEPSFVASLTTVDGKRVASGRDFDQQGRPKTDVIVLDEAAAGALRTSLDGAAYTVRSVEAKESKQRPKAPFITSTLQQVGGSRLRMSARQVMQVAQGLYERGYITYMRTDSTTLSAEALSTARTIVRDRFGADHLPDAPRSYEKKAKGAQEAHEAIRPAGDAWRSPEQLDGELKGHDLTLYRLIYQRTLASQMVDARVNTTTVKIGANNTEWSASGTVIVFAGWRAVYGFSGEDSSEEEGDDAKRLPTLAEGDVLPQPILEADGHSTQPPARYTEATLVRALEELGIGRPSTYASIMSTIQDRGYVFKKGQALVPTTAAFAVTNLLTQHFSNLVDFDFTAKMESDLDDIAEAKQQREPWLAGFYFGADPAPGLKTMVQGALDNADPAAINAIPLGVDVDGNPIELRNGKFGPYVKRGDDTASIPVDLPLDELTIDKAVEYLNAPKGEDPIGEDPETGLPVFAKSGRFGPYVQLGDADTLPPKQKPKMASLFKEMALETLTLDDALRLLSLPRVVGADPADGEEITAQNGRYGPYISKGKESRSLETEEALFTITLDEALKKLAEPKTFGRRGAPKPPLRELGDDPVSGAPMVLKEGRFGPYVTDGETNASLRAGDTVEEITPERASELLQIRREAGPAKKKKKAAAKKAPAKKKAPVKAKKQGDMKKA
ncbi:MAG TPA: type I DNA topoisomerase, partial [Acidimicrobiales bacterium]|nr:type I DNA topoisomerase [Acidimicrobiales bacterium]